MIKIFHKLFVCSFFALILVCADGCGGKSGMSSPQTYGGSTTKSSDKTDSTNTDSETWAEMENPMLYTSDRENKPTPKVNAIDPNEVPDLRSSDVTPKSEHGRSGSDILSFAYTDVDDSAAAVDDVIWRRFELAEEYYIMGVMANREASWEEAQYYFEKGLKILAKLDVESDSVLTPEAVKYTRMLDNFVADYRVTLRSLGQLEPDVSANVIVERFGDLARNFGNDSIRVFGEERRNEVVYDLPVVMNDRVKKSIVYFQTVAKDAFYKYLNRSLKYKAMMLDIINEYGLPQDLIYLSLVESGYNPNAYSWARAMGLWQFISSTGRMYGLKRSWWIDERKDPVKSTHAACSFLKDLYEEFGSWELAMAAYNGGPGRVRGTIKKQKTNDFWKMKLKRQTMDYIPLIYAAAIIAKNPEKYGFDNVTFEQEIRWDEVEIDRCLEFSTIASSLDCSVKELKTLNPELLRKHTPPEVKKYKLKIPIGKKRKFLAAYDSMPSPRETSWVRHRIRKGEAVSTIAAKYGVSQYAILEANNLSRRSTIYAGKKLIVPVPLDREYRSGSGKRNKRNYKAKNSIYDVRSGDTMWDIARAFGTSVDALRRINYIGRGSRIYVGQKLKIPSSARRLKEKNETGNKSRGTYASTTSSEKSQDNKEKTHKVRSGDTLWDIARKFGVTTTRIRRMNGLGRSSRIYPGQILVVSDGGSSKYVVHKVRRGDTLSRIAQRYRTSIARIIAANDINDPDELKVGAKLKIYTK